MLIVSEADKAGISSGAAADFHPGEQGDERHHVQVTSTRRTAAVIA